jgi:hypothetical protein
MNTKSPPMSEQPTTTLQVWPTADGKRWRVTCPFHHEVPLVFREEDVNLLVGTMSAHVEINHGWKVTGVQVLSAGAQG